MKVVDEGGEVVGGTNLLPSNLTPYPPHSSTSPTEINIRIVTWQTGPSKASGCTPSHGGLDEAERGLVLC
jgi:hypothetical protein